MALLAERDALRDALAKKDEALRDALLHIPRSTDVYDKVTDALAITPTGDGKTGPTEGA